MVRSPGRKVTERLRRPTLRDVAKAAGVVRLDVAVHGEESDGGAAGIKADRQGMGAGGFASTLLTQVDSKQSAGRKSLIGT